MFQKKSFFLLLLFCFLFSCKPKKQGNFDFSEPSESKVEFIPDEDIYLPTPKSLEEALGGLESPMVGKESKIISAMGKLAYNPSQEGICYGLAYMGAQAALKGRKGILEFASRMENIKKGRLDRVIRVLEKTKGSLSQGGSFKKSQKIAGPYKRRSELEFDLLSFFDGVKLYFGGTKIGGFSGQRWKNIYKLFKDDSSKDPLVRSVIGNFIYTEIVEMIEFVIGSRQPVVFTLGNKNHVIALMKGENGRALLLNHDSLYLLPPNRSVADYISRAVPGLLEITQISLENVGSSRLSNGSGMFDRNFSYLSFGNYSEAAFLSARSGNKKALMEMIEKKGVSPNSIFSPGDQPLSLALIASSRGYSDILQYLIKKGAQVSEDDFGTAMNNGYIPVLRVLMKKASSSFRLDYLRYLFGEKGITSLKYYIEEEKMSVNKRIGDAGEGFLHLAAVYGHLDAVRYLVSKGADLDMRSYKGGSPLDYARGHKQEKMIRYLESLR